MDLTEFSLFRDEKSMAENRLTISKIGNMHLVGVSWNCAGEDSAWLTCVYTTG